MLQHSTAAIEAIQMGFAAELQDGGLLLQAAPGVYFRLYQEQDGRYTLYRDNQGRLSKGLLIDTFMNCVAAMQEMAELEKSTRQYNSQVAALQRSLTEAPGMGQFVRFWKIFAILSSLAVALFLGNLAAVPHFPVLQEWLGPAENWQIAICTTCVEACGLFGILILYLVVEHYTKVERSPAQ